MEAIKNREADFAVLPIENSTAGIVQDNYDLLTKYDHVIVGEQIIPCQHALVGLPGTSLEQIKDVYSHPQALMQCRNFWNPTGNGPPMSLEILRQPQRRLPRMETRPGGHFQPLCRRVFRAVCTEGKHLYQCREFYQIHHCYQGEGLLPQGRKSQRQL